MVQRLDDIVLKGAGFASAAILVLAACAAPDKTVASSAAEVDPAEQEVANVEAADGDEQICKMIDHTGSRFKKRVCATEAEWERTRLAQQEVRQSIRNTIRTQGGS
ncbi:MAG: hypothetical protein AAFS13_03025 [Pseudomonadota bacterium]